MKKVAVITGTTSGIGKAIAAWYKGEGFFVVGINRRSVDIPDYPMIDRNFVFDLSYRQEVEKVCDQLRSQFKSIEVLVNNAGVMYLNDFSMNIQTFYNTAALNFRAVVQMIYNLQDILIRGGHIINIASVSGIMGDTDAPIYSATKAAIINLTRSLAKAFAPNIRVNCISPGFFNTNLVEGDTPQGLIDQVPMKREAQPVEIWPVIRMLEEGEYITGANIVIDGGLSL